LLVLLRFLAIALRQLVEGGEVIWKATTMTLQSKPTSTACIAPASPLPAIQVGGTQFPGHLCLMFPKDVDDVSCESSTPSSHHFFFLNPSTLQWLDSSHQVVAAIHSDGTPKTLIASILRSLRHGQQAVVQEQTTVDRQSGNAKVCWPESSAPVQATVTPFHSSLSVVGGGWSVVPRSLKLDPSWNRTGFMVVLMATAGVCYGYLLLPPAGVIALFTFHFSIVLLLLVWMLSSLWLLPAASARVLPMTFHLQESFVAARLHREADPYLALMSEVSLSRMQYGMSFM
jgi:hypothetical protein